MQWKTAGHGPVGTVAVVRQSPDRWTEPAGKVTVAFEPAGSAPYGLSRDKTLDNVHRYHDMVGSASPGDSCTSLSEKRQAQRGLQMDTAGGDDEGYVPRILQNRFDRQVAELNSRRAALQFESDDGERHGVGAS